MEPKDEKPKDLEQPKDGDDPETKSGEPQVIMTPAQLEARLARERAKYADYGDVKKERDALKKQAQEREDAEKSELEKLQGALSTAQAEREELAGRLQDTLLRTAIEREAAKANFHDPAVAFALVDLTEVEIDENGDVTGADKAVKALAKAQSYLVKTADKPETDADRGKTTKAITDLARRNELRRRSGLPEIME